MKDEDKTKEQLIDELASMRQQIASFSALENKRKDSEDRLKRYEFILSSMADGVYIVNQQYDIEYMNPAFKQEFSPGEGRKCYQYFYGRQKVCPWCRSKEVFAGKTVHWEWYSHQNQKTYDIIETPLKNPDGTISDLKILRDITEHKRTEAKLEQTMADLERSNAELEQFASVVSHDLQNPLRVVLGYLQRLQRRYKVELSADAEECVASAVDGATWMEELINDLLDFSRVGTHGKDFEPTDCGAVLDRALENLKVAIEEGSAVVTSEPLPVVMGDDLQLEQLFQNLISNAIKFHGDEPPRIHVSAEQKGDEFMFSVRDNGIGIAPEHTERIFEIFQRLHSRSEYPGTGIGLGICQKIVERHGGCIWVESQPEKGSTFYFTIPTS
jgi:signal transduction histidine kinase